MHTIDDAYPIRVTPSHKKTQLTNLKNKAPRISMNTDGGPSTVPNSKRDRGEEALQELIAQQNEMKRELGLD